jgi:FG-GAP-like repeat/Abnormal spindle-like microcephaly-assoc'd, ASPM-SPD-2-Hydin
MRPRTKRSLAYICASLIFVVAAVPASPAQTYSFGQAYFATGKQPMSIASGDFNGDGKLDLAVANLGANTVSIFLGKPDGTFSSKVDYATGLQPYSVSVGDLNGDGNLDVVVTNENCAVNGHISGITCGPGSVSVLLGIGDGTFQPQAEFATGAGPVSVTARDLNGDGTLDLVVGNAKDNSISILLGNGDGTFAAHVDYAGASSDVIVADFNNDTKPDVAAVSATGVSVWLGNGDGTLQTSLDFRVHDPSHPPTSLAAADFNKDGKQDLAVSDTGASTSIFLGNGDGTFTFGTSHPSGSGATIALDLNNDGKSDLAVVGTNSLSFNPSLGIAILLGNGDGTFQPAVSFASAALPSAVVAGDFNGDGQVDLVISNNSCFTTGLNFPDSSCAAGSATVLLGNGHGVFGTATQDAGAVGTNPSGILHVDLNNDQKPDLVVVNQRDDTISVLLGNGDGTFAPQVTYATGHMPVAVQAGDFKGNGKVGLAVVNQICAPTSTNCTPGSVSVLLGNGDGTLQAHQDFAVGVTPISLAVADFNGDGKPDLAVTNNNLGLGNTISILTGKGDGTFNAHVDLTVVNEPGPIVAADFNHDGKVDLAVGCYDPANTEDCPSQFSLSILLGNGDATFQRHDLTLTSPNFSHGPSSLIAGDLNGDGFPDLIAGDSTGSGFAAFLGKGDGTFQLAGMGAGEGIGKDYFALGDFFGDGNLDVALAENTPRVVIFHGNGDGTFQSTQALMLPADPNFTDRIPVAADLNGDGSLDLAVAQAGSTDVSVFLNEPFKAVFPTSLPFGSQGVNTDSEVQSISVANPAASSFTISSVTVSGRYAQTNNCVTKLSPGQSCTINVTFSPTAAGVSNGSITLADSTQASPQVIPLTGVGVTGPFLQLSRAHLTFPPSATGISSTPQTVALANTGNASLAITNIGIVGGNAGDFAESNTCGSSLAVGAKCSVSVTFTPSAGGARASALTIADGAPGNPHTVTLSGTGTGSTSQLGVTPTSLTFASQSVGTASAAQTVTVTNGSASAITVSQISATGDFKETNNCGSAVAATSSCQISVTFTPTEGGSRTGTVTVAAGSGGPQTIALSGTGVDFSVSTGSSGSGASATVAAGATATYPLSLAGGAGFSGSVALTCSGAPTGAACSISPASVTLSGTTPTTATVTVTTTARSAVLIPAVDEREDGRRRMLVAPGVFATLAAITILLLFGLRSPRRRQFAWAPVATFSVFMLVAGIVVSGCGGGSNGNPSNPSGGNGTAAGDYTITVTATAGSGADAVTHATKLTLVVQ